MNAPLDKPVFLEYTEDAADAIRALRVREDDRVRMAFHELVVDQHRLVGSLRRGVLKIRLHGHGQCEGLGVGRLELLLLPLAPFTQPWFVCHWCGI